MPTLMLLICACDLLPFVTAAMYDERLDLDQDGVPRPNDCDDNDATIGVVKQYPDVDKDGYGYGVAVKKCDEITGYAMDDGDCDDQDAAVNPDAQEICDEIDNDCDEGVDVDPTDGDTFYADSDGDTFGDAMNTTTSCAQPDSYVTDQTDCDDNDATINPDAIELCDDEIDNDCDDKIDEDASYTTQYQDSDGDGYGDPQTEVVDCDAVPGYVTDATDCDDTNENVNPAAEEICNNAIDDNCDDGAGDCLFGGTMSTSDTENVIVGEQAGDNACQNVASLGDLNADGYDDLLIGAPLYGSGDAGIAYIVLGATTGTVSLTDSAAMISGTGDGDQIGTFVSSAGDFSNDGETDLVVASPNADDGNENAGGVYIFFGPLSGALSTSDASVTFTGALEADALGTGVTEVGDINTDGYDDLLVGAPGVDNAETETGAAYLIFGTSSTQTQTIGSLQQLAFMGEQDGDKVGGGTATSDVNGDGTPDLLVGAPGSVPSTTTYGTVYMVYGPLTGPGEFSLSDAELTITGASDANETQINLSGQADVDRDGNDDLLIGAPGHDGVGADSGAVYLMTTFDTSPVTVETAYATFNGGAGGDRYGSAIAIQDLNLDGEVDLIVGAPYDNTFAGDAGATTIFFGSISSGTTGIESADATILGEASSDFSGSAIAVIGYVNDDDFPDFATGAPSSDRRTSDAGACFLFSWLEL